MIQNLRKLRISKGLSQQQLADVMGISQQSINKYENHNVEPDISALIKIADYFETTIDYLVGHDSILEQTASDFKQGGQTIQRIRKERGMTQEKLAELTGVASNSISRIERGVLIPALPTLIDICNALSTGADSILAAYITADTPIRWTPLAEKLEVLDLEKQHKIEAILDCLIKTI